MRRFGLLAGIVALALLVGGALVLAHPGQPAAQALPVPAPPVPILPATAGQAPPASATPASRASTTTPQPNEERVLLQGLGMI